MYLMREGTLEGCLGLQAGDGAHELNLVAGLVRCAAGRTVTGVVLGASDDLGHVLLEELLAPRGGRV